MNLLSFCCFKAAELTTFNRFLMEAFQMQDVPQVPPDKRYKDISGVPVYQENFDTLKWDKYPDDVVTIVCSLIL